MILKKKLSPRECFDVVFCGHEKQHLKAQNGAVDAQNRPALLNVGSAGQMRPKPLVRVDAQSVHKPKTTACTPIAHNRTGGAVQDISLRCRVRCAHLFAALRARLHLPYATHALGFRALCPCHRTRTTVCRTMRPPLRYTAGALSLALRCATCWALVAVPSILDAPRFANVGGRSDRIEPTDSSLMMYSFIPDARLYSRWFD